MQLKYLIAIILVTKTLQDDLLTNFMENLLYISFNITNCLHVVLPGSTFLSSYFQNAVKSLNMSVVLTTNAPRSYLRFACNGYVVLGERFLDIEQVFSRKTKFVLRVHQRLLIITADYISDTDYALLEDCVNLEGMDIVTVEGVRLKFANALVPEPAKNDVHVTIKSVRNNKTLFEWDMKSRFDSRAKIPKVLWQPVFKRRKFVVGTAHLPPYVYHDQQRGVYDGIEYRIFKSIVGNWPIDFILVGGSHMYTELRNGTSAGMYDISFFSVWATNIPENTEISYPYTQTCVTFLVPISTPLPDLTFVFQPLNGKSWLITIALIVSMGVIFAAFYRKHVKDATAGFLYSVRIITLAGIPLDKQLMRTNYFSFALLTWCALAVLLTTGYSSGLSSLLAYPRHSRNIRTLQDMLDNDLNWMSRDCDTVISYNKSDNKALRLLAPRFVFANDPRKIREYVFEGNTAIRVQKSVGPFLDVNLTRDEHERMKLLQECTGTYPLVFMFGFNSPFKRMFDKALQRIVEHGFLKAFSDRVVKINNDSDANVYSARHVMKNEPRPIGLQKLGGALYLLISGYAVACVLFVNELVRKR